MKNKILSGAWVLAVAVVVVCGGCKRQPVAPAQLMGTVFIVTEGAQTFRLPLTTVEVVKADEFRKYWQDVDGDLAQLKASSVEEYKKLLAKQRIKTASAPADEETEKLNKKIHSLQTAILVERHKSAAWNFFFGPKADAAAPPVAIGQTDADGKFKVQLSAAGTYFIKARAKRRVGGDTESYQWVIPVTISVGKDATVDLSNQNLATRESLAGVLDFSNFDL